MRSCPSRAIGSVSAWIGNAVTMPSASRAAQIGSAMPKSRKALALLGSELTTPSWLSSASGVVVYVVRAFSLH
jgi:hypothetical protein